MPKPPNPHIQAMIALKRTGLTNAQIAAQYHLSAPQVGKHLQVHMPDYAEYHQNRSLKSIQKQKRQAKVKACQLTATSGPDLFHRRLNAYMTKYLLADSPHIYAYVKKYLYRLGDRTMQHGLFPKAICAAVFYLVSPVTQLFAGVTFSTTPHSVRTAIRHFCLNQEDEGDLWRIREGF